ncbi:MAG: outer membrane beta-barrel protein [Cyclobacteriaceae bacterium]|nr:outer membrane beta-barrel protein [Cyclobacteriaceae bacterium]
MSRKYTFLLGFVLIASTFLMSNDALSQDVIILKDGRIIHAKVLEVDLTVIKYKKASYLEGPLYSILRSEVYAIAYDNHSSDYFDSPYSTGFVAPPVAVQDPIDTLLFRPRFVDRLFSEGMYFSVGLGMLTSYSKAKDGMSDISKQASFPPVFIRAFTEYDDRLDFGVQLAFTSMDFVAGGFNEYDAVLSSSEISESVFSLIAMAKYKFGTGPIRPYSLLGAGFNNSRINTRRNLRLVEDGTIFSVRSTARVANLAIMLRAGVDVGITQNIDLYADLGTGISLIQAGASFRIR